jgi:DNA polymerase III subunit epsilon
MTQEIDNSALAATLASDPNYRVLRRFVPRMRYKAEDPPAERIGRGVILDTETTGKEPTIDRIIEIGLVGFTFDRETGDVLEVTGTYNALEDPGIPIDPAASRVNGITDEMVKGRLIDDAQVEAFVKGADIVIAHNAQFDRAFCEPRFPFFKQSAWGCSRSQVDWEGEGIGGQKMDYIAFKLGFFYEAHRAEADCLALLEILAAPGPVTGQPALKKILEAYKLVEMRIWAIQAPFEKKSLLSARVYRWGDGTNGKEKAWNRAVTRADFDDEITWLKNNVYGSRFKVIVDTVDELSRFSPRRVGTELMQFS